MRGCLRHRVDGPLHPPAPAAARHRVGLAPSGRRPCRIRSSGLPDDADFWLQIDTGLVTDDSADVTDQRLYVVRTAPADDAAVADDVGLRRAALERACRVSTSTSTTSRQVSPP